MIETQHIEYKSVWKDDFLRNLCAFANSEGGILYIGIQDDGTPVGVSNSIKLLETLPHIVNQKIGIIPSCNIEERKGKQIIKLEIPASSVPISYNGRFYMRSGSVVLELHGRELSDFLLKKSGSTWDSYEIDSQYELDIDNEAVETFKKLAFDRLPFAKDEANFNVLLQKLNLLTPSLRPTKAAFLLFDKNPQRLFPQAIVKIGRFISDSDIVLSDVVKGNLFKQVENTLAILKSKYLLSPITYEGVHRREILEYPYEALREAIFNALIHRDYNTTSAILIKVYNGSLSIANEGKLPAEITVDDLKREHLSKPRNTLLAGMFYNVGYIESWGRGTLNIIKECKKAHLPEPNFYEEHGVVKILFELNSLTSRTLNGELNGELNKGQIVVLQIIEEKSGIKMTEIAQRLHMPFSTVDKHIRVLLRRQMIERRGSKKTGGYFIIDNA